MTHVVSSDQSIDFGVYVTLKEVLPSAEEAKAEVERLNSLNPGSHYAFKSAKYYPDGRAAGTQTDAS